MYIGLESDNEYSSVMRKAALRSKVLLSVMTVVFAIRVPYFTVCILYMNQSSMTSVNGGGPDRYMYKAVARGGCHRCMCTPFF